MLRPPQPSAVSHRRDRLAIVGVAVALLLITGSGLSWLFVPTQLQQLAKLGELRYHEDGFRHLSLALSPARLLGLQLTMGGTLLLGLGGWLAIGSRAVKVIGPQLLRAIGRLRGNWQRLPASFQRYTLLLLTLVLAARLYYLVAFPLSTDEIASFDYFVSHGPRVIFSYYPIPNNHLLYNLLAWPLRLTALPPLLVMRLPTYVLGAISLLLTLGLLSRIIGWRRALLISALTSLTPLSVYYGAVGRGYGLQLGMLQVGFFAVLELLRPKSNYRQLAWAALMLSSVAGLLLVPSYVYPLVALLLGAAAGMCRDRNWPALGSLTMAGAIIGVVVVLLYSPIGAISGWDRLLANRYVTSRAAAQFWPGFRPRLYEVAAELFGLPVRVSGPLWLGIALLGGAISGRMLGGARRRAALLAWLLVALPIGLLAAQRVFPLARVLLYIPWAGGLWLMLGAPRLKSTGRARKWALPIAVAGLAGMGLHGLYLREPQRRGSQRETRLVQQAYSWLRHAVRPGSQAPVVGLQAPIHELFFAHYLALSQNPSLHLVSYRTPQPDKQYDFIVLTHAAEAAGSRVPKPYLASYSDILVTIYTNPAPRQQPAAIP
ncbi:hypothetical protein [Hymenobacter sp. UYCo722]|uniref:hypothetical protein n=1 Tax=Hymenobacter sp. UYCo722 TaxID=3156335 RepID=UPI0033939422